MGRHYNFDGEKLLDLIDLAALISGYLTGFFWFSAYLPCFLGGWIAEETEMASVLSFGKLWETMDPFF